MRLYLQYMANFCLENSKQQKILIFQQQNNFMEAMIGTKEILLDWKMQTINNKTKQSKNYSNFPAYYFFLYIQCS